MKIISSKSIVDYSNFKFGFFSHPVSHILPPVTSLKKQCGFSFFFSLKFKDSCSIEFAIFRQSLHILIIPSFQNFNLNGLFSLLHNLFALCTDFPFFNLLLRLDLLQNIHFFFLMSDGVQLFFQILLRKVSWLWFLNVLNLVLRYFQCFGTFRWIIDVSIFNTVMLIPLHLVRNQRSHWYILFCLWSNSFIEIKKPGTVTFGICLIKR